MQGTRAVSNVISIPVLQVNKVELADELLFMEDTIYTMVVSFDARDFKKAKQALNNASLIIGFLELQDMRTLPKIVSITFKERVQLN